VFTLLGRVPELHVAVLGALKNRSVVSTLFPAFGPEPVRERLALGDGRVLVTTPSLYRRKVAPIRDRVPLLRHVVLVGAGDPDGDIAPRAIAFDQHLPKSKSGKILRRLLKARETGLPEGDLRDPGGAITPDAALALLTRLLRGIAPRVDLAEIDPDAPLAEAADLDSMDHLNLVNALCDESGIDIPERDFPLVTTIDGFVAYVVAARPKEARHVV
jgi:acyl carrier protein